MDSQCCDSFRGIAKGLSHTYTCIHSLPNFPPIHIATWHWAEFLVCELIFWEQNFSSEVKRLPDSRLSCFCGPHAGSSAGEGLCHLLTALLGAQGTYQLSWAQLPNLTFYCVLFCPHVFLLSFVSQSLSVSVLIHIVLGGSFLFPLGYSLLNLLPCFYPPLEIECYPLRI